MAEQNQQGGRRPHYHRGRRGSDRRGPDRRNTGGAPQEQPSRDQYDVDQIMREIRARISQHHGIELSTQQIQELAARRLEAILDPRTVNPSLLEQLRRSAGRAPDRAAAPAAPAYEFEDWTIYESRNGLLRWLRKVLNPILKLFFNPNPIAHALNAQTKLNAALAAREAERDQRHAEWNALHYDILQRIVTETARVSVEIQALSSRVESLNARVDFNDRRVRIVEAAAPAPRPPQRQSEPRAAVPAPPTPAPAAVEESGAAETRPEAATGDGARRRRRRRRGRRSGGGPGEAVPAAADAAALVDAEGDGEGAEFDEGGEDDLEASARESSMAYPIADAPAREPATSVPAAERPAEEPSTVQPTAAAAPAPFPTDGEGAAATPSAPRDEPAPVEAEPKPESGPEDR